MVALSCCGDVEESARSANDSGSAPSVDGSTSSMPGYRVVEVTGGTIGGRVMVDGAIPEPGGFEITTNPDVCGGAADNNRLQVGQEGGIAWAVIRLVDVKEGKKPRALSDSDVLVDQVGCRYTPHVIAVPLGTRVYFRNSDPTAHNVRVEGSDEAVLMNVAQAQAGDVDTFLVERVGPMSVGCDYHPWMNAYVFGVDNPYYAVTGPDGRFEIDGIPPGEYELRMWLNGFEPTPKRDNRGNIVRYGFSPPYEESRSVTVAAGKRLEEEFRVRGSR